MQERLVEKPKRRVAVNSSHRKDRLDLSNVREAEKFDNMLGLAGLLQLSSLDIRSFINRKIRIQYFSDECVGHFELNYIFRLVPSFSSS